MQRHVFLSGKCQLLFADVKLSKRGGKYENDQRFQGAAENIFFFLRLSLVLCMFLPSYVAHWKCLMNHWVQHQIDGWNVCWPEQMVQAP